jgi:hypothetical protein
MVWQGLHRRDAAKAASLAEHSLYQALRRAPVRQLYLAELEVLRTSGRARRIRRYEEISEQDENKMAAVAALKALDQIEDVETQRRGTVSTPGLVIQILTHNEHMRDVTNNTLIDQQTNKQIDQQSE